MISLYKRAEVWDARLWIEIRFIILKSPVRMHMYFNFNSFLVLGSASYSICAPSS